MSANTRTCLCCGKKFKYCPNCSRQNNGYNMNFDTKECAELFNAVSGYNMGVANSNAINKLLNIYHIESFSKYVPSIADVLYELFPRIDKRPEVSEETPIVTTDENEPEDSSSLKNRFSRKNKSHQKKEVELSDKTEEKEVETTGISEEE